MKTGIQTKHKRLILLISGALIFLLSFLLIFQKNMEETTKIQTENVELRGQIDFLTELQIRVNKMKATTKKKQKEIEKYTQEYPCKMTQQKVISNLYQLKVDTGMDLLSIKPVSEAIFFKGGQFVSLQANKGTSEGQNTKVSEVEKNPEMKVPLTQMIGKTTSYDVEIIGTRKQILKAFDWISKNKEHMALTDISLSFDTSTGKLTGTISINFYSLNGNGVPYEEPDISGIILGNKDVFGSFKK